MELMTIGEIAERLPMPEEQARNRIHYLIRTEKLTPSRYTGKGGRIALFDADKLDEIAALVSADGDRYREETVDAPTAVSERN